MKASFSIRKLTSSRPFAAGLLALSLALGCNIGALQPGLASVSSDERLAKLEVKFFKHTYLKDDDDTRLDRLEKMIFGETRDGSDVERLKNLAATVPNLNELPSSAEGETASAGSGSGAGSGPGAGAGAGASSFSSSGAGGVAETPVADDAPRKTAGGGRRGGRNGGGSGSGSGGSAGPSSTASAAGSSAASAVGAADDDSANTHHVLSGESKYPAVTAMEQQLFKRDYAADAIGDRLNRLETKVFGRPSRFTDMVERVDALKEKTNIDIASRPPAGTDWTDEDEDNGQAFPVPKRSQPVPRTDGDDGKSFSGRDVSQDLKKAFGYGSTGYTGPSGAYGMSGTGGRSSGNSASGAYGMGGTSSSGSSGYSGGSNDRTSSLAMTGGAPKVPAFAAGRKPNLKNPSAASSALSSASSAASSPSSLPSRYGSSGSAPANSSGGDDDYAPPPSNPLNLNQQVGDLESAVLGKQYSQDPLTERVARLEKSVFPKDQPSTLALPARVARLAQKVPTSSRQATSNSGGMGRGRSSGGMGRSGGGYSSPSYSSDISSGSAPSSSSGGSYKRPSGWIDEDVNMGYGGGSRSSSSGSSGSSYGGDDDDYGTGMGSATGLGAGAGLGSALGMGAAGMGGMAGMGMGSSSGMSGGTQPQAGQKPGGLSKIINSIGNALSGGFTGGYNINSTMTTDPATGLLRDNMTGNLINPTTGAVVGRSSTYAGPVYSGLPMGGVGLGGVGLGGVGLGGMGLGGVGLGGMPMGGIQMGVPYGGVPYGGMPYGGMPYGGFNGFNNGFSPYGTYGNGIRFGGMGGGVRLGF